MHQPKRARARLTSHCVVALSCLGFLGVAAPARAELKVRSPLVTWREFEFEHNGLLTFDKKKSDLNGNQSYTFDLGYGLTPWWGIELEAETQALAGQNVRLNARTLESTFQILPQGKYSFDLGVFAEFANAIARGKPNEIVFGPILQKEAPAVFGVTSLHTLNTFLTREVGRNRTDRTGLQVAAQSRLRLEPLFEPGIEVYYNVDDLGRAGRFRDQNLYTGPVFAGAYALGRAGLPGSIKYEAAYLFGTTPQSSRGAVRWRFEYEIAF
ncbi:MAG: hypothetical protein NVSMB18_16700 [Acetobacteraceae bacterium]